MNNAPVLGYSYVFLDGVHYIPLTGMTVIFSSAMKVSKKSGSPSNHKHVCDLIMMHLCFSDFFFDMYTNYLVCLPVALYQKIHPCCLRIHLCLHIITSI